MENVKKKDEFILRVKKKTIANWIRNFAWFGMGYVIGATQGDWSAWLTCLIIFILAHIVAFQLERGENHGG